MAVAFYPGSFDPPHNGHIAIVQTAVRIFDELYIGVGYNPEKRNSWISTDERVELLRSAVSRYESVKVLKFEGLATVAAHAVGADCLYKGVRSSSDIEDEMLQAQMNSTGSASLPTLFAPGIGNAGLISSRYVRQVAQLGGDVSESVPTEVSDYLLERFS